MLINGMSVYLLLSLNLFREGAHLQASDIKESLCLLNILVP